MRPRYGDLVAAILSVYVDVTALISRYNITQRLLNFTDFLSTTM